MADAAFAVYRLALITLPFRWLSPVGSLYEHGTWTDLLIGVAAVLWLVDRVRTGRWGGALRIWHVPLGLYLVLGLAASRVEVPGLGGSAKTILLMAELAVFAVLTADFAADPGRRRSIARTIVLSAWLTVGLGVLGLGLFYLGVHSGLVGSYGEQYIPSHLYTRVQAGFESPPLLASFCIFAAGVACSNHAGLSPRTRRLTELALGLLCAATLSRGLIAFLFAAVLRRSPGFVGARRWAVPLTVGIASLGVLAALTVGRLHLDPVKPASFSYTVPDPGNRRQAFVTSLHTFEHHPLLGIGPGALPGMNAGAPFRAHFTPLNVAATLGLPALLALVAMLWLLWRRRQHPTDLGLWSALAGVGIDGLAQDIDHFRHVWVLIGLLGA